MKNPHKQADMNRLSELLKSGNKENIELAFQLTESNNIGLDLFGWCMLSEWLYRFWVIGHYKPLEEAIIMIGEIRELVIVDENLLKVPRYIGLMSNLTSIHFRSSRLNKLPKEIGDLPNIKDLTVVGGSFSEFPSTFSNMNNLEHLCLNDLGLDVVPDFICKTPSIKRLFLETNKITEIPKDIENITSLEELFLHGNLIKEFPRTIGSLKCIGANKGSYSNY